MQKSVPEIVVKHRLHLQLAKRGECLRRRRAGQPLTSDHDEYYIAVINTDKVLRPVASLDDLARREGVIGCSESIAAEI